MAPPSISNSNRSHTILHKGRWGVVHGLLIRKELDPLTASDALKAGSAPAVICATRSRLESYCRLRSPVIDDWAIRSPPGSLGAASK